MRDLIYVFAALISVSAITTYFIHRHFTRGERDVDMADIEEKIISHVAQTQMSERAYLDWTDHIWREAVNQRVKADEDNNDIDDGDEI